MIQCYFPTASMHQPRRADGAVFFLVILSLFLWFPSFPSFFLFLPFPCSAILSPVFFLFLGLFRLVCWCCFVSFHCCACFLISCYLILLVFSVSHLPCLPFLFCFHCFSMYIDFLFLSSLIPFALFLAFDGAVALVQSR